MKKVIINILILLVTFNVALVASIDGENFNNLETVEITLDSLSGLGTILLIVLSSLLGAYFLKDEFSSMLD